MPTFTYVTPDTALPRQRATDRLGRPNGPLQHPWCIMVHQAPDSLTRWYRRTVSNIRCKRAALRIARMIERGVDPAAATFDVLG